jgi:hypothetical protein
MGNIDRLVMISSATGKSQIWARSLTPWVYPLNKATETPCCPLKRLAFLLPGRKLCLRAPHASLTHFRSGLDLINAEAVDMADLAVA